jgi:hypothetical protein
MEFAFISVDNLKLVKIKKQICNLKYQFCSSLDSVAGGGRTTVHPPPPAMPLLYGSSH